MSQIYPIITEEIHKQTATQTTTDKVIVIAIPLDTADSDNWVEIVLIFARMKRQI